MTAPRNRNLKLDVLRLVAMLMVLVLHTFKVFTENPASFGTTLYWILLPVVILAAPAVSIFFIVSSYLVLPKQQSVRATAARTIDRLIIPLFFFEAINFILWVGTVRGAGLGWWDVFYPVAHRLSGFPSSPLWFLYTLVVFYLCNPVLQTLFLDGNKRMARYATAMALLFIVVVGVLAFPTGRADELFNVFTGWLRYIFFYLYGGLLAKGWALALKPAQWWGILVAAVVTTGVVDTMYRIPLVSTGTVPMAQEWLFTMSGYFGPLLVGVSLVHIVLEVHWRHLLRPVTPHTQVLYKKWVAVVSFLTSLSFGVYLFHPLVISPLLSDWYGWRSGHITLGAGVFEVANFALVFGISAALTYLVRQVPYVRAVVGERTRRAGLITNSN